MNKTAPQVACAGILVADTFCGPMDRLPDAGELLALADMPTGTGGCAANVAIDLARQNIPVKLFGCVGSDTTGDILLTDLQRRGIDCDLVRRHTSLPTSKTVILLVKGEDRRYIHSFGANAGFGVGDIDRASLKGLKVFYLGGLCALPALDIQALTELLQHCRAVGITTVVDVVAPRSGAVMVGIAPLLPHVDYFVPNDDEARCLTGCDDPAVQARVLMKAGVHTVIITRGVAGAFAARGGTSWRAGAHALKGIDPSGSGDAFCSGIIAGILNHWDMPRMLQYASALGASATRQVGTTAGVFSTAEAQDFIAGNPLPVVQERFEEE